MLYLYDKAICNDLEQSFTDEYNNSVVKVVAPEDIVSLAAQIKADEVSFPLVAISRDPDTPIDTSRTNFTWMHQGVQTVIDPKTNLIYNEKVIPVKLGYHMTVLTTNTVDMDELVKELLHKYMTMFFLHVDLPYESKRRIRFGIEIDSDSSVESTSAYREYVESGKLYQTIIALRCTGCVQVLYTPQKLVRTSYEIDPVLK